MTLSAVPWTIDQIGATIPLRRLRRIGLKWLAVKKQQLPAAKRAADIERERQIVVTNLSRHRRQRFQIGEQVAQIVKAHALI